MQIGFAKFFSKKLLSMVDDCQIYLPWDIFKMIQNCCIIPLCSSNYWETDECKHIQIYQLYDDTIFTRFKSNDEFADNRVVRIKYITDLNKWNHGGNIKVHFYDRNEMIKKNSHLYGLCGVLKHPVKLGYFYDYHQYDDTVGGGMGLLNNQDWTGETAMAGYKFQWTMQHLLVKKRFKFLHFNEFLLWDHFKSFTCFNWLNIDIKVHPDEVDLKKYSFFINSPVYEFFEKTKEAYCHKTFCAKFVVALPVNCGFYCVIKINKK